MVTLGWWCRRLGGGPQLHHSGAATRAAPVWRAKTWCCGTGGLLCTSRLFPPFSAGQRWWQGKATSLFFSFISFIDFLCMLPMTLVSYVMWPDWFLAGVYSWRVCIQFIFHNRSIFSLQLHSQSKSLACTSDKMCKKSVGSFKLYHTWHWESEKTEQDGGSVSVKDMMEHYWHCSQGGVEDIQEDGNSQCKLWFIEVITLSLALFCPQVYQHMKTTMFTAPNAMSRSKDWREMTYAAPSSKL